MAFNPPVFNIVCNIWRSGSATSGPPDVVTPCNLALSKRVNTPAHFTTVSYSRTGRMWLLLPKGTDIRDSLTTGGPDTVECPAGSGRFYGVDWVDDAGGGFTNEHRIAWIVKNVGWPVPIPSVGPSSPAPSPGTSCGTAAIVSIGVSYTQTISAGPDQWWKIVAAPAGSYTCWFTAVANLVGDAQVYKGDCSALISGPNMGNATNHQSFTTAVVGDIELDVSPPLIGPPGTYSFLFTSP